MSIALVSEVLPTEAPMTAEAINGGLGKTGAPGREALCCPSEVPNMG